MELARSVVGVAKQFNVSFMGLAGTAHQVAAQELGVKFIAGRSGELSLSLIPYCLVSLLRGGKAYRRLFFFLSEEWFADLDYSPEGKLLITKYVPIFVGPGTIKQTSIPLIFNITCRKHDPLSLEEVESRVSTNRTFRASRRADSDNEKKNNNLR